MGKSFYRFWLKKEDDMDNSVDRKNAIRLYLTGTIGQITVIAVIVYLLRRMGIVVDYTTVIGMIAIGIGGSILKFV